MDELDMMGRGLERGLARFQNPWTPVFSPWGPLAGWLPRIPHEGSPSVEVSEENDELVVRVEFAGVKPEDLKVWVKEDTVTVAGERRAQHREQREGGYFRSERHYGMFQRTIPLPMSVDVDRARATFEHGVLEIRAPKRDTQESRFGRRLPIQ